MNNAPGLEPIQPVAHAAEIATVRKVLQALIVQIKTLCCRSWQTGPALAGERAGSRRLYAQPLAQWAAVAPLRWRGGG